MKPGQQQIKREDRKYRGAMTKVAFWAVLVILVALFVSYYLDTPVPEEIQEKWKVKVIDASMRTYKHLVRVTCYIFCHKI